jgi:hypothetical protein
LWKISSFNQPNFFLFIKSGKKISSN